MAITEICYLNLSLTPFPLKTIFACESVEDQRNV